MKENWEQIVKHHTSQEHDQAVLEAMFAAAKSNSDVKKNRVLGSFGANLAFLSLGVVFALSVFYAIEGNQSMKSPDTARVDLDKARKSAEIVAQFEFFRVMHVIEELDLMKEVGDSSKWVRINLERRKEIILAKISGNTPECF